MDISVNNMSPSDCTRSQCNERDRGVPVLIKLLLRCGRIINSHNNLNESYNQSSFVLRMNQEREVKGITLKRNSLMKQYLHWVIIGQRVGLR